MKEKKEIIASVIITAIVVGSIVYLAIPTKIVEKEVIVPAEEELNMEGASFVWAVDAWLGTMGIRAAKELGFFEEENLDVTINDYGMGIDTLDAILAGTAEMGNCATYAFIIRAGKGDIGLCSFDVGWGAPIGLWAREDIKNYEDLEGKKIATVPGSVWDYTWYNALEKGGLTKEDVEMVSFASGVDYLAAAKTGDVDAGIFWDKLYLTAEETLKPDGWHVLADFIDVLGPEVKAEWSLIPVKASWAKENPDVVARALRAVRRGSEWANLNPMEAAKLAEKTLGVPAEEAYWIIASNHHYVGISDGYIEKLKEIYDWTVEQEIIEEFDLDSKIITEPLMKLDPNLVTYKPPS